MTMLNRPLILASGSPYRAKLLREIGVAFDVAASDIDESLQPKSEPAAYVRALATRKALAVAPKAPEGSIVLAADTICAIGNEILGKPTDNDDAVRMITLACETGVQRVMTGVCLVDTRDMTQVAFVETTLVQMREANDAVIRAYVATGEPMGKCGALCIESGGSFVKRWQGSFSNVVGLPLERTLRILTRLDVM